MRKRFIPRVHDEATPPGHEWLDLERLAVVELTSEDPAHPIEFALRPQGTAGWRAGEVGKQTIRLVFDHPQQISRVRLRFEEYHIERTQEYVLRWSPDGGLTVREIVRQQWNFSPQGATVENEDYPVELSAVTMIELNIIPDIGGKATFASLKCLRVA